MAAKIGAWLIPGNEMQRFLKWLPRMEMKMTIFGNNKYFFLFITYQALWKIRVSAGLCFLNEFCFVSE